MSRAQNLALCTLHAARLVVVVVRHCMVVVAESD
jgi:hypothetical protein